MMPVAKKACISWRLKIKKRKEYQFRRHMKIKAVVEELKCLKEDLNSEVLNRTNIRHNCICWGTHNIEIKQLLFFKDLKMISRA